MFAGVKLQELRGEFEIKNFQATCEVKCLSTVQDNQYIEIPSPPLFGTEGQQFCLRVGVMCKLSEHQDPIPDPDKPIGLQLQFMPGSSAECYCKLNATVVNTDPSKSKRFVFSSFRIFQVGILRGWLPTAIPPRGLASFKEVIKESNGWLHAGALRVEMKLLLAIDDQTHIDAFPKLNPHQDVCADLSRLFQSGEHTDVVIKVKDEELHAHSLILSARSNVFAVMLSSPMREGTKKEVVIEGIEMAAVKAAVEFLYSGEVEPGMLQSDNAALGVLEMAHRYNVDSLVNVCVQTLASRLSVDVVAEWFYIADLIGSVDLRVRCMEFIRLHISEVQGTESFKSFIATRPALVSEILASVFPPAKRQRTEGAD